MEITNLATLKAFLSFKVTRPVFGVGVYAFDRLGLEDLLPNFRLLALRYSRDTELIEKDIEVFSLEKGMGTKHIAAPRNATTVITHPRTKEYLARFQDPALIVYKSSSKMERVCRKNGWTLVAPPVAFGKKLFENKIIFRRMLEELGAPVPPGEVKAFGELRFKDLHERYGFPFVIQHPSRGGGKGTFFIRSREDFERAMQKIRVHEKEGENVRENVGGLNVIVAKYITGPSPSITGCVTRHGILSTSPQYQLIDIPELYSPKKGSGLFCGHDWSSSRFDGGVERQAYDIVERVGLFFQKRGYKGIFGLDFVLDEKEQELYVTEANPRLLASFPVLSMVQLKNDETPILAFHLLEYLGLDYAADINSINSLMRQPKEGAQMFPHNLTGHWTLSGKEVRAGVYRLRNSSLRFVRAGYAMKHLQREDEILLADGVLQRGAHYSPNRRLGRIVTRREVLAEDKKTLNPWARAIAENVHAAFALKPVRFVKIIRFFKPDFLAKG